MTDITAIYSPAVSWFYDTVAADAVLDAVSDVVADICTAVADGGSVLEVGCGGGQFAHRLISLHPGISVTGIDLSAEQIARANKRSTALPLKDRQRLHFQTASALDIPFAENTFDAVVSIASIKHWPDREKGVHEMVRVLKDRGRLLITETDRSCHLDDARRFARSARLPTPLRLPYLWMFRTYVAGQGLDLDDARRVIAGQDLVDTAVQRVAGTPFLTIAGTRR
ncbi:class I SAM-dependent methyltransferase [Aldersonia sp. NBC_00410]|uniref:class I SAM-dependent methyltransferase n=1 Tax=Aldersonia sp. NBC_00410 TaxID=2975954 RepID=UPI00225679A8|nr:class I SAM-dependent methyltransferase [Aldersonia sp. NBC_00410]MCX5042394.1 class I SAM-dependent methyltransferase [Aldersonia sp. NBC_00410]